MHELVPLDTHVGMLLGPRVGWEAIRYTPILKANGRPSTLRAIENKEAVLPCKRSSSAVFVISVAAQRYDANV